MPMSLTTNAKIIYDYFLTHPNLHPSADDINTYLRSKQLKMGIATIYRNLNILVDQGYIREISIEKQGVFYDLLQNEHYHFICDKCNSINNFVSETLNEIDPKVEDIVHGKITGKHLLFHGICQKCLDKAK